MTTKMDAPSNILMIKAHSVGIGDILRGSAAWRALKNQYPNARLHLLLLTREPGYPSEELIARHHLLDSFHVVDKRTKSLGAYKRFAGEVARVMKEVKPDWVIDFEPNGLRTTWLALYARLRHGARTFGVGEVPLRGWLYGKSSTSFARYAAQRNLGESMDYTYRDFVVLTTLGIERNGIPLELQETPAAVSFRKRFMETHHLKESDRILGINIGCGTPGAGHRRANMDLISELAAWLQKEHQYKVVLCGAKYEREVNAEFARMHKERHGLECLDGATTTMIELPGLLSAFSLFVSSDSGPYHMAVGLKIPTICLFTRVYPPSYHKHDWVRCIVYKENEPGPIVAAAAELLKIKPPENMGKLR